MSWFRLVNSAEPDECSAMPEETWSPLLPGSITVNWSTSLWFRTGGCGGRLGPVLEALVLPQSLGETTSISRFLISVTAPPDMLTRACARRDARIDGCGSLLCCTEVTDAAHTCAYVACCGPETLTTVEFCNRLPDEEFHKHYEAHKRESDFLSISLFGSLCQK